MRSAGSPSFARCSNRFVARGLAPRIGLYAWSVEKMDSRFRGNDGLSCV